MLKLNFDGSAIGNPGRAGEGWAVRNSGAEPFLSFSRASSVREAELIALAFEDGAL